MPTADSIWIVEAPEWQHFAASTPAVVPRAGVTTEIRAVVDNLIQQPVVVGAFPVDRQFGESAEEISPVRDLWLYGEFGSGTVPDTGVPRLRQGYGARAGLAGLPAGARRAKEGEHGHHLGAQLHRVGPRRAESMCRDRAHRYGTRVRDR
jgi:hypothetical protein